jgi:hypothetical protein
MRLRNVLGGDNLGYQGQAPTSFLPSGTRHQAEATTASGTTPSFTHLRVARQGQALLSGRWANGRSAVTSGRSSPGSRPGPDRPRGPRLRMAQSDQGAGGRRAPGGFRPGPSYDRLRRGVRDITHLHGLRLSSRWGVSGARRWPWPAGPARFRRRWLGRGRTGAGCGCGRRCEAA